MPKLPVDLVHKLPGYHAKLPPTKNVPKSYQCHYYLNLQNDYYNITSGSIQTAATKKDARCNRCKAAGFPNQLIGFERVGEDFTTGKISWKLIDEIKLAN